MGKVRMKNKFSKIKFLKFKMDYWATSSISNNFASTPPLFQIHFAL